MGAHLETTIKNLKLVSRTKQTILITIYVGWFNIYSV